MKICNRVLWEEGLQNMRVGKGSQSWASRKAMSHIKNKLFGNGFAVPCRIIQWWRNCSEELHFYSTPTIYRSLYNNCHIHTFRGASCSTGGIWGSVSCSWTLWHAAWRAGDLNQLSLWILDDLLYLLSYSGPHALIWNDFIVVVNDESICSLSSQ